MADKEKRKVGSYEWRGENSLRLVVRDGSDPVTGEPIKHQKTVKGIERGDTKRADIALAAFITDVKRGKYKKPSKMTVKQLSERFLRDYADASNTTKENYKIYLDDRILPALGDNKIIKIKPAHIYDFMNNLKEDGVRKDGKTGGLSPATIQKYFHIISSMFAFAVDLGELEDNPCENVKPPKIPKRKKASIDKAPARDMLRALANESLKWRCITLLAISVGDRRGEILGAGDSTIDFENCIIRIDRAVRHSKGGRIYFIDPKTEKSKRVLPFHQSIIPLLLAMRDARDKQRGKCGEMWVNQIEVNGEMIENDLFFTQWNGKPMHPNSVDGWFCKFKKDNNLPDNLKFHGLRHTNISQLLKHGVDLGTVQDNSGHANPSTTLDYNDPDAEVLREVADKANIAFDLENIIPDLINHPVNIYRNKKKKSPDNITEK